MHRKIYISCLVTIFLLLGIYNHLWAQTVPPPLKNVKIQARVVLDENGVYHYYHTVTNPAENKIGINDINTDITFPNYGIIPEHISAEGYTEPDRDDYADVQRRGLLFVPIAYKNTSLWRGGIILEDGRKSLLGNAVVNNWRAEYNFATRYQYLLNPGQTSEELEMISYGLPGIRKVIFRPDWTEINWPPEYRRLEEEPIEVWFEKDRKKETLSFVSTTIGPTAPPAFTPLQFNQLLQEYVSQCVTLGWLKDATLTQQLNNYLTQSATAIKENRLTDAQNIITQFMNAVQNSNLSQRTTEAHGLLYYNARFFFQQITAEIPPTVEISPNKAEHNLNETHTTHVRVMRGYVPESGYPLTAWVITGPHEGLAWSGSSNEQGYWSFNYKGERLGTDIIQFVVIAVDAGQIIASDVLLWQPYT
ncbi:MAG TPA: hypothetical protein P5294_04215, partial [Smithellaceae bacterium]|nr:hypothetical protein [Smithellaceae bacterium]